MYTQSTLATLLLAGSAAAETIHGVVVFSRHGDSKILALTSSSLSLFTNINGRDHEVVWLPAADQLGC